MNLFITGTHNYKNAHNHENSCDQVTLTSHMIVVTAGSEGTVDCDVEVAFAFLIPSSLALALALAFWAAVLKQLQCPP
jgi:hypothetical protein